MCSTLVQTTHVEIAEFQGFLAEQHPFCSSAETHEKLLEIVEIHVQSDCPVSLLPYPIEGKSSYRKSEIA